jgi:hypothetical protein
MSEHQVWVAVVEQRALLAGRRGRMFSRRPMG